jgi:hypothetical protein
MLQLVESSMLQITRPPVTAPPLRSVRPSVLDLRFTGDPWIVDQLDGTATIRLDNYRLARIQTLPFDVPSLNRLFLQLRQCQTRRRLRRQLRALAQ